MSIQPDRKMPEEKQALFYSFPFFFFFYNRALPRLITPALLTKHLNTSSAPEPGGTCRLRGPRALLYFLSLKLQGEKTFPASGPVVRRAGVSGGVCAFARACAEGPGNGWGVKKGPAFERQRRKMAATTGSGERGRRARPAEGARARAGGRGLAKAIAA